MTTNVIDAIREKEADAHAEREEAFAERNRLNQAFFDGKLIAYAEGQILVVVATPGV